MLFYQCNHEFGELIFGGLVIFELDIDQKFAAKLGENLIQ